MVGCEKLIKIFIEWFYLLNSKRFIMIDGVKKLIILSFFDDFGSFCFKSKDEYKNVFVSY